MLINDQLVGEVYSLFDGSKVESIYPQFHQYSSKANKYIIVDEPESESIKHELELILHEGDGVYVLTNWIRRVTDTWLSLANLFRHLTIKICLLQMNQLDLSN